MRVSGRVRLLGDDIDTDIIAPGKWMNQEMDVLKIHAFEAVRPDFYKEVEPGDILVAGRNFGYGSHREQANSVLKALGIQAVIADSIARIYFRNCIALGIPAIIVPRISHHLKEGEEIEISLSAEGGKIIKGQTWSVDIPPMAGMVFNMLKRGGILPLIKEKILKLEGEN